MVENNKVNSIVSKSIWGAVRWADLSISDASNSWLCTQSDAKNESKSLGLASLLQKSAKLNDSLSESLDIKGNKNGECKNNEDRGMLRGFLKRNKTFKNETVQQEKLKIITSNYDEDIKESCEEVESIQELGSLEFKFGGDASFTNSFQERTSQINSLVQGPSLISPKIIDDTTENISINHKKKRNKDYSEELCANNEDPKNLYLLGNENKYKKVKHSRVNDTNETKRSIIAVKNKTKVQTENSSFENFSVNQQITSEKSSTKISSKISSSPQNSSIRKGCGTFQENNSGVDWNKRISSRLFQIAIGKGTKAYQNYLKIKPRKEDRDKNDPQTPNAHMRCPQKQFVSKLNHWRKSLHKYDDLDINIANI
ncbi:replication-associated histone mRNA stem loop-bindingprotein [Cryptosporidium ryanae]|uniref:replication-associated histone mRNA stem loop-bindingprotein n=1 Tax=Cryptosporidium ryanae TaxID=515981 RepID=UPI00351AAF99|nr:replication-associated histone mRNA stem loop-bindingprotein [Cryptosporidium ryanae]